MGFSTNGRNRELLLLNVGQYGGREEITARLDVSTLEEERLGKPKYTTTIPSDTEGFWVVKLIKFCLTLTF
jgi:hypothetical protein